MNPEIRLFILLFFLACRSQPAFCQNDTTGFSHWYITLPQAGIAAGSFVVLNEVWYKDFDRTRFHFFNDLPEWKQVDKMGHTWTSYQLTRLNYQLYKKSSLSKNKSLSASAAVAQGYMTVIEVLDGFSKAWGFSPYDVAANITGSGLFIIQEKIWAEQRVTVSFSYFNDGRTSLNPGLLGKTTSERILKDYNSQTFWLNINPSSFLGESKVPEWLDVSIGSGVRGLSGGRENHLVCRNGSCFMPIRERQWYLSAGIRFSRIRTNSRILRTMFFIADAYRIPLPAISISGGKAEFQLFGY